MTFFPDFMSQETFLPLAAIKVKKERDMSEIIRLLLAAAILAGCAGRGDLHAKSLQHNMAGIEHIRSGNFKAAKAAFQLAIEYNADFSEAHNNLGIVAMRQGDVTAARQFFSQAVKLNADFAEAWNNLGVISMREADYEEARKSLLRALEANPGHVEARLNLAQALLAEDDLDACEMEVLKVLEESPERLEALLLLAAVRIELEDFARAGEIVKKARSQNPDSALAWFIQAKLHLKMGRSKEAVEALEQADMKAPAEDLWLRLGFAHAAAGGHERALFYFRKFTEKNPSNPYGAAGLVLALARKGGKDEVKEACETYRLLETDVSPEAAKICKGKREKNKLTL